MKLGNIKVRKWVQGLMGATAAYLSEETVHLETGKEILAKSVI